MLMKNKLAKKTTEATLPKIVPAATRSIRKTDASRGACLGAHSAGASLPEFATRASVSLSFSVGVESIGTAAALCDASGVKGWWAIRQTLKKIIKETTAAGNLHRRIQNDSS
jgi:hypothetical protein